MPTPLRAESPSKVASLKLSPEERARAAQAAEANHQTFSQFCRDAILTAAEDCLEIAPHPRSGSL